MTLNFCQIQQLTTVLAALECLKNQCLHFFPVANDLILFKHVDKEKMRWMYSNLARLDDRQQRHPPLIPLGVTMGGKRCILFFLLAHLSRWLLGELIVYPWSSVRRPSVRHSQCSSIFFSETAWPIKAKFSVEPPWVGGTKFCSRHLSHMTKMAATPIYGKKHSKSSIPEPVDRYP